MTFCLIIDIIFLLKYSAVAERGTQMKNHNIKAALFDLDGVIVFTDKYHYLAWKALADEQGWDFDEKLNNQLRGIPRLASLEVILRHNGVELPMEKKIEFMEKKNNLYVKLLENINEGDIYPGAVEFLKKLRAKGTKISLCSSSKNAVLVLDKLGLTELFDAIVTGHDIKNAKPDPEIFLLGAEKLRMPVFHCCVFEDAKAGIEGAKAAGMKNVGVGNREETEGFADQFIMSYDEIDIDTFLESGLKQPLPVDENSIIEEEYNPANLAHIESLFALGNGYMGLRGAYDEEDDGIDMCSGMYINGIFATKKYEHLAKCVGFSEHDQFTVNLSDWRIFNVVIDGEKACFSKENIKDHTRVLDFRSGLVIRTFVFETSGGKKAEVTSLRMVSMTEVNSAHISYSVKPLNFSGKVTVESKVVKLTEIAGGIHSSVVAENEENGVYSLTQKVNTTEQLVAMTVAHTVNLDKAVASDDNTENVYTYSVSADLNEGEILTVEKYAAFGCSMDTFEDIEGYAFNLALINRAKGFDALVLEQKDFWDKYWVNADIVIEGNPADQQAVRFSLFQLRQQLVTTNACSIGATGLTGPGYSGKVFWDTEMYLMPYYNFTYPETQKELMMYRYRILDKARARAKVYGTVGAQYAWCGIDGDETSVVFEASVAEYHLNSDIAHSVWRYVDSTGDKDFLYDFGAEMVFETAKFMSHRGRFIPTKGNKFCINVVCGPDEYACGINNNMYTNLMVQLHLYYALEVVADMKANAPEKYEALVNRIGLTAEDIDLWQRAADNMYYKYNEDLGIHEQDDSFIYQDPVDMELVPKNVDIRWKYHPLDLWRMQVIKQADVVLANFIRGNMFTIEEKERNYNYYEPKCNHGSSLSTAIHSIMASELGKHDEAYQFFRCSAYMDISDFKHNTADGLHLACLGGVWMTVVNGFLGMRHYPDGVLFNPHMPAAWKSYSTRFTYRGATMEITVDKNGATFTLVAGNELSFATDDAKVTLTPANPTFTCNIK